MSRIRNIYQRYLKRRVLKKETLKNEIISIEGHGYIKRRLGLISNEMDGSYYSYKLKVS